MSEPDNSDVDRITFSCAVCGSDQFKYSGRNDDDMISCNGCGREVGTVAVVRQAIIKEGKTKLGEIASKAFGKTIKFD